MSDVDGFFLNHIILRWFGSNSLPNAFLFGQCLQYTQVNFLHLLGCLNSEHTLKSIKKKLQHFKAVVVELVQNHELKNFYFF